MKKLLPLLIVFFGFNSFAQTDEIKREAAGISYLSMHDLNSSEYVFNFENLSESEAFLIKEKLFGFHQVYFQNWASNFSYVEIKFSSNLDYLELKENITSLTKKLSSYSKVIRTQSSINKK